MKRNTAGPLVDTRSGLLKDSALLDKRWNLRQLQCLVSLSETLHFGRAARRLNMSQSAFSRQIQLLETAFGIALVERDSHKVAMTTAGRVLAESCGVAFAELRNGMKRAERIQKGYDGELRIGYTDFAISSSLPGILAEFTKHYPGIVITSFQGSTDGMIELLSEHELDIVFGTGPIHDPNLHTAQITTCRIVVLMPEGHRLATQERITMGCLRSEPFIFGNEQHWGKYLALMGQVFKQAGYAPNIVARTFNSEGIFGLVSANLGITLYPNCAENFCRRDVVIREVDDAQVEVPVLMVWRKSNAYKPLEQFLLHMEDVGMWRTVG